MKYLLYIYKCKSCEREHKAPALSSNSYGEFLLRSPSGEVAYLNAMEDPVYEEVSSLLKNSINLKGVNEVKLARLLQHIFGVACDKSPNGGLFKMGTKPVCPFCSCNKASSWRPTDPVEFVEEEFPHITHKEWELLSDVEKAKVIESAVPCVPC